MPPKPERSKLLSAIDIFAGGGGLTVGLKRAGFKVLGAVELEPNAFATYKANHPEVQAYKQDVRTIQGESLLSLSPTHSIDLVAGCPPCQGFCSLTAKYKRKRDDRNALVREMARLIVETKPTAIMMENVPGLCNTPKGKRYFREFIRLVEAAGYSCQHEILQVADYGVPQSRRRLVLLAGYGFKIDLPEPTHCRTKTHDKSRWRSIREVIGGLGQPVTIAEAKANGGPSAFNWHVVRSLAVQNQRRLKQARPGKSWTAIPKHLRPECHKEDSAGFGNVYGRMKWSQVSPSITGGCTTLSKGRFGHPQANRTISVREAAMIQTFPVDYILDTPYMEYACRIVGNALPCDFAAVLARQCEQAIRAATSSNDLG